jgi:LacI family transcriptional regulator
MSRPKSRATIYDVASRANVAISTVSRVLNNSNDVSEPTRIRVQKAIEELQFRPDRTAKTLAQKSTKSLAIAIPTFTTPFHTELLKGCRMCLQDQPSDLLLCDLGSKSPHATLLNFLKRGAVDGLLVAGVAVNDAIVSELRALRAPVVLIGARNHSFDSYYWNNVSGAETAVNHLIESGHRRIGMIISHTDSELQQERIAGYRQALEQAQVEFDPSIIVHGRTEKHAGFSEEAGYEAMQQLLEHHPDVTAVFASSDVQAIGAWKAVRDAQKRVPEDIALVGYDDIKTSAFIGLTSVDQSMHDVGEQATNRLLDLINGNASSDSRIDRLIQPKLIVRDSSNFSRVD